MKKLGLMLLGGLLFCCNANADLICVKQKVAPTKANKVLLSNQIKVVTTENCPKGFKKLINTETFRGPQGEKGDKGDKGDKGGKGDDGANFYDTPFLPSEQSLTGIVGGRGRAYVSLQIPSAAKIEIANPWECEGSVLAPTAPAGKVCIYSIVGAPKAEAIPTRSRLALNTKTLCHDNQKDWVEAMCIANKSDGVTPIDTSEECQSGPYAAGNTWNGVTNTCTRSKWDKVNCESPLYEWDETKACFVEGVLTDTDNQQACEDNQQNNHGYWIEKGCKDGANLITEAFPDKRSCLAPSRGTWVPAHCSVTEITQDVDYGESSNAGFMVTAPAGEFVAIWAYTAPEAI